jgi:hypothetical protein
VLAQHTLQDLAGTALRKIGFRYLYSPWNLVIGQAKTAIFDQSSSRHRLTRFAHYAGHHNLAPFIVRDAEDCSLANSHVPHQDGLNLPAVHVFSARHDHVFQPVEDIEVAFGVLVADVTSVKEAAAEGGGGVDTVVQYPRMTLLPLAISSPCSPGPNSAPDSPTIRTSIPGQGRPQDLRRFPACSWSCRPVRKPVSLSP